MKSRFGLQRELSYQPRRVHIQVAIAASLLFGWIIWTSSAMSAEADGVYGRFDGDLAASVQAGAHFSLEGCSPRAFIGTDAHVYWTLGAYAGYEHGLHQKDDACAHHAGALGIQLRPLFLLRFVNDWEQGPATLDLFLDSVTLGLGGYVQDHSHRRGGFELFASLGLPLVARAPGPWLRGQAGLRFDQGPAWFLRATVAYEWLLQTPFSGQQ